MSIAALKRKTNVLYRNLSSGGKGFSIVGTRRNQGYIGQTSLERHLANTPMRGNVAKGSGGCCGTYYRGTIVQSGVNYLNNPSVVKTSVLGNSGMLRTQYRWIWRPAPYTTVKPTAGLNLNNQSDRITRLSANYAKKVDSCTSQNKACSNNSFRTCSTLPAEQKPRLTTILHRPVNIFTKDPSDFVAMSQSDYLYRVKGRCLDNDVFTVTKSIRGCPTL